MKRLLLALLVLTLVLPANAAARTERAAASDEIVCLIFLPLGDETVVLFGTGRVNPRTGVTTCRAKTDPRLIRRPFRFQQGDCEGTAAPGGRVTLVCPPS